MADKTDKKFLESSWICMKNPEASADGDKAVNPWETRVTADFQKAGFSAGNGLPVFRKSFGYKTKKLRECRIYITALGIFDLYMNGMRVGKFKGVGVSYDELKPGWTDYDKRVLYYTYNLSRYVEKGINTISVALAPGWWQGRISLNTYGTHDLALNAVIECEYEDGTKKTIYTDESWKCFWGGPVLTADIWDGEIYDGRKLPLSGYSVTDFDDSAWDKPLVYDEFKGVITKQIGPSVTVRKQFKMFPKKQTVYSGTNDNGTDFGAINVLKCEENACSVKLRKGQTVQYDMGQNMVGWSHITVKGKKDTTVIMRYGEMLNDSGKKSRGNDGPDGSVYTANYRSARAKGYYILSGEGIEEYRPTFTFYGFRYVEIEASEDIEIVNFKADVVGSDIKEIGKIQTSSKDINKLISNIFWGQRGNYLSVPTDCPQRDERLGWTGDTQIFSQTAAFNGDVDGFFHKWLQDARDSQSDAGAYTDVIPRSRVVGQGNAAWGDAGIIVPYIIYRTYNDKKILKECYASMVKYMDYLSNFGYAGPHPTYGDWLAYEPTESAYISMCYYAYDSLLMEKMSAVLGKNTRAKKYAALYKRIKREFQKKYCDRKGRLTQTSQSAYLHALKLGLLPDKSVEEAKKLLAQKITDNGYRLSTGFLGTGILCETLSEIGYSNLAYSLLLQTENPSWLYSVYQGATTIWERWNSYTLEKGFGDVGMNSFNHYSYGAVAAWMYKYMLGIDADDNDPGFRHIILRPTPDTRTDDELPAGQKRITWAKGQYDSYAGMIKASWSIEPDSFTYNVTVPAKAYATLYLPVFDENAKTIVINGTVHSTDEYRKENDRLVIDLSEGSYFFSVMR